MFLLPQTPMDQSSHMVASLKSGRVKASDRDAQWTVDSARDHKAMPLVTVLRLGSLLDRGFGKASACYGVLNRTRCRYQAKDGGSNDNAPRVEKSSTLPRPGLTNDGRGCWQAEVQGMLASVSLCAPSCYS